MFLTWWLWRISSCSKLYMKEVEWPCLQEVATWNFVLYKFFSLTEKFWILARKNCLGSEYWTWLLKLLWEVYWWWYTWNKCFSFYWQLSRWGTSMVMRYYLCPLAWWELYLVWAREDTSRSRESIKTSIFTPPAQAYQLGYGKSRHNIP